MLRLRGGRARASEADQAPKSKKRDGPGGRTEGREEKSTKKLKKSTEGRENKSTKKKTQGWDTFITEDGRRGGGHGAQEHAGGT